MPSGVAVQCKQVIKTKPKKAVWLGRVAAKGQQVVKTKLEKVILPSGVTTKRKQVIKTKARESGFAKRSNRKT
jgi:hypothetical protein